MRNEYTKSLKDKLPKSPLEIIIEAYFECDDMRYSGRNNELLEDACGIRVRVYFKEDYGDIYQQLFKDKEIYDIPVEFYSTEYKYFSGETVVFRYSPIKAAFIDTTRKDYSYIVDKFVSENITSFLTASKTIE